MRAQAPGRIAAVCLLIAFLATISPSLADATARRAPVDPSIEDAIARDGQASFWLVLGDQADLSAAPLMTDWNARGEFVMRELQRVARRSQSAIVGILEKRQAPYQAFWIVNAVHVTGTQPVLEEMALRPEIAQIRATRNYEIPQPEPGEELPRLQESIEWGVARVGAPEAWAAFGQGEGIVVANIDTGVDYDHPAVVNQYRGNLGGGVFDHNYNWHDPSNICGNPSTTPCDNNDHGTHTMGTMLGDDGGANQIGVAPGASWIAAKGCESSSCSDTALLSAAQWILAPTDLQGQNARPDLRPQVVNNSWGGGSGDDWYMASVDAWIAAGIFPQFSVGNSGPSCGSAGSPGDYPQSYAAGGFDINDNLYSSSSRGISAFGVTKPDISAPAVSVRSSFSGGGYGSLTGTSMASPHVAGTVALMWSAAPSLFGDIEATKALLDASAVDRGDSLTCGGDAADNNTWGEGMLDSFAAVDLSPRGPTGILLGNVTEAGSGLPLSGASVNAVGPSDRTVSSDAAGDYSFSPAIPVGSYDVTVGLFGYLSLTATGVVVVEGLTTTQDFLLLPAPSHTVSGFVRDPDGQPVSNATVTFLGTPIPAAVTDASGFYSVLDVPEGDYDVEASSGRCSDSPVLAVTVDGDEMVDFDLVPKTDAFGYTCNVVPRISGRGRRDVGLSGDDVSASLNLPFPFPFYGETYNRVYISSNGTLNFLGSDTEYTNGSIPSSAGPNAAVYPFWDDLVIDAQSSVTGAIGGAAGERRLVIEWRNVHFYSDTTRRVGFQVFLFEDGRIQTQYVGIDPADGRERGDSATVGIEDATGTIGLQYSFNEAVLDHGSAILFTPPGL